MSMQYTIRSIPEAIDRAVRHRARREDKSINAVVVEALARGLDLEAGSVEHTDLDHQRHRPQTVPAVSKLVQRRQLA